MDVQKIYDTTIETCKNRGISVLQHRFDSDKYYANCFCLERMIVLNKNDHIENLIKNEIHNLDTNDEFMISLYINDCIDKKIYGIDKLRRGDIIRLHEITYRNNGVTIWNGKNAELFDVKNYDEYGTIPTGFNVLEEFPIKFWHGVRDHNNLVHFDCSKIENIEKSIIESENTIKDKTGRFALVINVPIKKTDLIFYDNANIVFFSDYVNDILETKNNIIKSLRNKIYTSADSAWEFEDYIPTNFENLYSFDEKKCDCINGYNTLWVNFYHV